MKTVITGALGHIGSRLIREWSTFFPGSEVVMLDNLSTQRYCSLFNLPKDTRYTFIEGDVLKYDLASLFTGADYVIHLAAITEAAGSFTMRDQVEQVNFQGSERVAQACAETGSALIFPSTTSVYGPKSELVAEDCSEEEINPQSPYAESKYKAEEMIQNLGAQNGLRFIICRLGTISGVSIGMRFHTAVNKFCWQAVMNQPITIWRTALLQKRPYLSLTDGVRAIGFMVKNHLLDNRVYNILTDNLTPQDIVHYIEAHIPNLNVQYTDSQIMNTLSYDVSSQRIQEKGFIFQSSVKQDIAETISWLRSAGGYHG